MSLTDRIAAARVAKVPNPPAILTLDIERLPGHAVVKHRGLHVEGEFWDLNSWKHTIGYRINPADVTEWPRTICGAWRWYGSRRMDFAAEWEECGREGMLRAMWDAYNRADIVVGHNLASFDTKKLTAEWLLLGLSKPRPWKTVDTLRVARAQFGFESNTLASITQRLGLSGKVDAYNVEMARAACAGDKKAQARITRYNKGDVVTTEELYDEVRPWMTNHPHIGLWTGLDGSCWSCGSADHMVADGWAKTDVTAYAQYFCTRCMAWSRAAHMKGRVNTRPVR